jgi:predicted metal-dependent hydrolase
MYRNWEDMREIVQYFRPAESRVCLPPKKPVLIMGEEPSAKLREEFRIYEIQKEERAARYQVLKTVFPKTAELTEMAELTDDPKTRNRLELESVEAYFAENAPAWPSLVFKAWQRCNQIGLQWMNWLYVWNNNREKRLRDVNPIDYELAFNWFWKGYFLMTAEQLSEVMLKQNLLPISAGAIQQRRVRLAAPLRVSDAAVRLAVVGKLGWIKRQRARFEAQPRQSAREMVSGESHYFLGRRYRLRVIERNAAASVTLRGKSTMKLHVRSGTDASQRNRILQEWYRQQLKQLIPPLVEKWQTVLSVKVAEWGVKKMKTRWGACNIEARRIWLNLELAKKPVHCLEYIVAHEMVHLIERNHNDRFVAILEKHLPHWRLHRQELNSAPLAFGRMIAGNQLTAYAADDVAPDLATKCATKSSPCVASNATPDAASGLASKCAPNAASDATFAPQSALHRILNRLRGSACTPFN